MRKASRTADIRESMDFLMRIALLYVHMVVRVNQRLFSFLVINVDKDVCLFIGVGCVVERSSAPFPLTQGISTRSLWLYRHIFKVVITHSKGIRYRLEMIFSSGNEEKS
jgi:hypothetical protein